jgi:hypothetical protein
MIMSGTRPAVLQALQLIDIHGTQFYDIVYIHANETTPRQARVGVESIYAAPKVGDMVQVRYLMNVVTGVELTTQ